MELPFLVLGGLKGVVFAIGEFVAVLTELGLVDEKSPVTGEDNLPFIVEEALDVGDDTLLASVDFCEEAVRAAEDD